MVGFGLLVALIGGCNYAVYNSTKETVTAKVIDKERIVERDAEGNASSKYLIFTNVETFENTDSLWAGKWNSSDVYGRIQEGQICEFTVVGFRVGWMSMYRNIIELDCEDEVY